LTQKWWPRKTAAATQRVVRLAIAGDDRAAAGEIAGDDPDGGFIGEESEGRVTQAVGAEGRRRMKRGIELTGEVIGHKPAEYHKAETAPLV
jgi:hypothetical protein